MGKFYKLLVLLMALFPLCEMQAQAPSADSVKIYNYLQLCDKCYAKDDLDSATFYCLQAGELAKKSGYRLGEADFISYYLPILNRQGEYQKALELSHEGVKISEALRDFERLANAHNNVGNQYHYLGDLKSAATYYLNALVFSEKIKKPRWKQLFSNNLASVFLQMEETSKSYYYAKKSYELASENRDTLAMASSLVNLASCEIMIDKYDDAIKHLDLVALFGKQLEDDSYILDSYINRGDLESRRKNYKYALEFYRKALALLEQYPSPDYELYVYWGLATNYHHLGSDVAANEHLKKSIQIGRELGALQELRKIYQLGSSISEKLEKYRLALEYRSQYEKLNDSLINAETKQNIHRLETEYRTAQKEKAIAEQKLTIASNEAEIQKKDKVIFLAVAMAVALLSAIIIVTMYARNRQRTAARELKIMEKQNELKILTATMEGQEKERSRLAQDLHDGVGGILSAAKMHISILSHHLQGSPRTGKLEEVMQMIDYASQEIRFIAHNLSPNMIITSELHTAIATFCERVSSENLRIDHYILGDMPKFQNHFKLVVYRTVQELLNNILKHSKATQAIVQMSVNHGLLLITVEDNGIGFDSETTKGIGLTSLKARVMELKGEVSIQSQPGQGTTVNLEFDVAHYEDKPLTVSSTVESRL